MAIVGYARVSTRGQNLEAQIKALKENGVEEEHLFMEKVSGASRERSELDAMLRFVRKGDTLIATKLDRIARSTKHLLEIAETLEDKGVSFKVLNINLDTSTPTGKLMLTMLGAIAQFERDMMLERQAEGFAIAKAKGRIKGRKPTARAKSKEIHELVNQGLTKQAVADRLGIGVASVYRVLKMEGT